MEILKNIKKIRIYSLLGIMAMIAAALIAEDILTSCGVILGFAVTAAGIDGGTTVQGLQEAAAAGAAQVLEDDVDAKVKEYTKTISPISTLMYKLNKRRKAEALKVEFGYVREKSLHGTVTAATTGGTSTTMDIEIDSINFPVFANMDTVIIGDSDHSVPSYNSDGTQNNLIPLTGIVTGLNEAASTIRVQCNNGFLVNGQPTFKDAIAIDTPVYRMSRAERELAVKTTPFSLVPSSEYNYCQNMIASLLASDWSELHKKRMEWNLTQQARMSLFDRARTKELSYMFGTRRLTRVSGEDVYMCGGIFSYIPKSFQLTSAATEDDLYSMMFSAFNGNNGNNTRFLFMGSAKYKQITEIPSIQKYINSGNSVKTIFGLEFDQIRYNGWTLYLYNHYMFDASGRPDIGLLLDLDNLEERYFEPATESKKDLKELREAAATSIDYKEVCCPQVYNPDTHMIVY
jgi:hypothetical protein